MIPRNRRRRTPRDPTALMAAADRAAYLRHQATQAPISALGLPVRVVNALEDADLILCHQLLRMRRTALVALPNCGEKTMDLIVAAIVAAGLEPPADWTGAPPHPPQTRR